MSLDKKPLYKIHLKAQRSEKGANSDRSEKEAKGDRSEKEANGERSEKRSALKINTPYSCAE